MNKMKQDQFFKPTALFKEYMILDVIEKNSHITQREIASLLRTSVSLINKLLDQFEKNGLIEKHYQSTKTIEYTNTKLGVNRRKVLNIGYLKDLQNQYLLGKSNITNFIKETSNKGFKHIVLYGAGEVAEIILSVINELKDSPLRVVTVIDDDPKKTKLHEITIIPVTKLNNITHDGILIASFNHHDTMRIKLDNIHYPRNKIIEFF